MEPQFEKQTLGKRTKSMLKVDFKRMFTMPLVYIFAGVCLVMPVLILVMATMMGGAMPDPAAGTDKAVETFTNVWQTLGALSGAGMSMDLTAMCNINLLYFLAAVFVCIYVAEDFRSGYVKNLFTVRAKKTDYVISKSVVCFVAVAGMFVLYLIGATIGGAIAGLSFATTGFGAGGIASCFIAKIFLAAVFVAIAIALSVVAKQRLWLSVLCSFAAGMLLFTMIPMIAPLDGNFLNVIMCVAGGAMFAVGLGAVSRAVLDKTSLV